MEINIYFLIDPINNEIRYIGRTKNNLKARLRGHIATAKKNLFKTKKDNWILKLKEQNLKPIIKLYTIIEGWTKSYIFEQELIKTYINTGLNLVNLHDRGEGSLLRIISDKQKKKISDKIKLLHKQGVYDSRGLKLTVYDLNGIKIKSFKNVRETANWLNISRKHLEVSLKRNSKKLHIYQIRRYEVDQIEKYIFPLTKINRIPMPTINSVNCLETPEEDNQQPSSCGNTEKGSTTSSESLVDNNSTTKAEQSKSFREMMREKYFVKSENFFNNRLKI